ncbi:MAG: hypothetical protein NT062_06160 [Proteobacteria bacterium]|nr:hypothetical protein [Pseudomonadota bacterium]
MSEAEDVRGAVVELLLVGEQRSPWGLDEPIDAVDRVGEARQRTLGPHREHRRERLGGLVGDERRDRGEVHA